LFSCCDAGIGIIRASQCSVGLRLRTIRAAANILNILAKVRDILSVASRSLL
jgi:hypothetical protein